MWKKCIITFILLCLGLSDSVMANNNLNVDKHNEIINIILPNQITRRECITAIMKVIGVDKKTANMWDESWYYVPMFDDVDGHKGIDGYIFVAKFNNITNGVNCQQDDYLNNFEPDRAVTVKECLTFMLRCLKGPENVDWNTIMSCSIEEGLIEENIYTGDELLTREDFSVLLGRMLESGRYLYWPEEDSPLQNQHDLAVDVNRSISYFDYIKEII